MNYAAKPMKDSRLVRISKFLSYHLRHRPDQLGLTLETGGWVVVDDLLIASQKQGFTIFPHELKEVVVKNDKQRFSFNHDHTKIRANQGHSIPIDLQLVVQTPPAVLYHGTAEKFLSAILNKGLQKMSRHHVHLSADLETAKKVGMRHGHPVILTINTPGMMEAGYEFYCSENNVWLVDSVPPEYLTVWD